jgi:hypothetical protein
MAMLLAVAGCTQPSTSESRGPLMGSHDLVRVGDLILVTSTERNELRALNLTTAPRPSWVRAPNPIEALSIPVLDHPAGLARDVRYRDITQEDGTVLAGAREVGGPYVYAVSSGAAEISIVGGDPSDLIELVRLPTPGAVTAVTGRGPSAAEPSTLFYASLACSGCSAPSSSLWKLELPEAAVLRASGMTGLSAPTLVASFPDEVVAALVTLPGNQLGISTRSQSGRAGRSALLDTVTLASRPLNFPGPVRSLFTHAAVPSSNLAAGARIYGILDEESCGVAVECSGIAVVDSATGNVALDARGQPSLTLKFGDGLPMGLAFAPNQSALGVQFPMLGIATDSSGSIQLFDAVGLRQLDVNGNGPSIGALDYRSAGTSDNLAGVQLEYLPGPQEIELAEGATRDELVTIEYQGLIPGLTGLPTADADGQRFKVAAELLGRVLVGDLLTLATAAGTCGSELSVSAIEADALVVADLVPNACAGRVSFSVRAQGTQKPYVVTGTVSGYLGRTGPGDPFVFQGSYFYRPDSYNPAAPAPQLSFTFGAGDPAVARGNRYLILTNSGVAPMTTAIEQNSSQPCSSQLPGSVVFAGPLVTINDALIARPRAFIAYPSANGVIELDPATAYPGVTGNGVCHR